MALAVTSCIEDGFTADPADRPAFSTDSVRIGEVFTDEVTPTVKLMVYNRHSKGLNISDIRLSGTDADCFRLNVDGITGSTFSDVEIRAKDSIYVLIEAKLPEHGALEPKEYTAALDFTVNGRVDRVNINAFGRDVTRLRALTLEENTALNTDRPYVIYDSLVVAPGVRLTVPAGTQMLFHDKAMLIVRGTLVTKGTPEAPVTLCGDRMGKLVGDIDFDIMSRQWTGVFFTPTSTANRLTHTVVKNTVQGVTIVGDGSDTLERPRLQMVNCVLRNSACCALESYHAAVRAVGCEFAEAGDCLTYMQGGSYDFNHCTFANNYLYAVIGAPALNFAHVSDDPDTGFDDGSGLPYLTAEVANCIVYGYGGDISHGDLEGTGIYLRNCILKGGGEDDEHFLGILWDTDPLFFTVRSDYFFDYRLQAESPAIGAADPALSAPEAATDFYGLPRDPQAPDLGAYVFDPEANASE